VKNRLEITKGGRFAKIIGNFGENVVCNWLSRSGFDVALIDHTGIDVVAYQPTTKKRLGITVKSRTRLAGSENDSVNLFPNLSGDGDRQRVIDACKAFACEPWIAVYVETRKQADLYLTSLENFEAKYIRSDSAGGVWNMSPKSREQYALDPAVKHVYFKFGSKNWRWQRSR